MTLVEKRIREQARYMLDPLELQALNVLPMPLLVVGDEHAILYANMAAEDFFQSSVALLKRQSLDDLIPFGSPVLALVEEDLGRDIAMRVASQLVMFFKRPGGQMQFSRKGEAVPAGRAALQELQRWVAANPALDHSVASLARRMDLSARHFARLFRSEVGITPATWVEEARVGAARRLLEQGHEAPKQVAAHCGFADADTLRRAFSRHVGVTPAEYRKRFAGMAS